MSFTVNLLPTNNVVDIPGQNDLLEELLLAGISLPYSCKRGICGACVGELVKGQVVNIDPSQTVIPEQQQVLLCQVKVISDIVLEVEEVYELQNIQIMTLPTRVESMELAAPDVMVIRLRIPPNTSFRFLPGQFIDLLYKGNVRRSYSIADFDEENHLIELHIRAVENGTFSSYVFNNMKNNDLLRFEGPLGSFFVRQKSEAPLIFLAGGTGFAPIKVMINDLLKKHDSRDIYIYWGASTVSGFYSSLPNEWAENHSNVKYIPVLSESTWEGRMGYVHTAVLEDFADLNSYEVFACGSPAMIEAAKDAFIKQGLPDKAFFSDAFV